MTISIIGASGEVGYKLVNKLCQTHFIKCVVRNSTKKDFSALKNVQLIQVEDISQTEKLISALESSDVIINTGYIWFASDIHNAIKQLDVKPNHIIFTGSTGIYTKLSSKGAQIKRDAELFIQSNYTIPWTIIRPTMIYGHCDDRNISRVTKVLNKTPVMPLIGNGSALIQPVFIDDLLKAYETVLLNDSFFLKSFNIGAEFAISNKELFTTISSTLKRKLVFISINPKIISALLKIMSLIKFKPISQEQVLRFQENKNIDLTDFVENFNYTPRPFEKGIIDLIKEMKSKNCL